MLEVLTVSLNPDTGKNPARAGDEGPVPVYYDFDDVLVPSELKIDRKASFVYATPNFASGVLVMDGYVDADSLVAEQLLQMLGLPREEAAEIARRPLPESAEQRLLAAGANAEQDLSISRRTMP